jgi:hypothetical protein
MILANCRQYGFMPLIHNLNLGDLNFWRVSAGVVFR